MAGRNITVNSGAISVSAGNTVVTQAVIASSTTGVYIKAVRTTFEGANAATEKGVLIEYCRWTADGSGGTTNSGAFALVNADAQDDGSPITTAKRNYTANLPSTGEQVLHASYCDANKGEDSMPIVYRLKQGEIFGVRITGPSGLTTTNARTFIGAEE
jgi:phage baseplate assembly protein gpV